MESSYLFQSIKDENDNPLYFSLKIRNLLANKDIGIFVNDSLVFKFITDRAGNITKNKILIPRRFLVDFFTLGSFGGITAQIPKTRVIGVGSAGDISLELRYI